MSYKFNLDHTLAIADIYDMITIDIKPETRCTVTDGDVEVHGYLTFRGSYLTPALDESLFEGRIPLDITLPYLGGAPDVKPEVISFDYRVENKESLTLNLEIALDGYNINKTREEAMDAWVDPIVEWPVYEEAVIEPFDFAPTVPIEESAYLTSNFQPCEEEVLVEDEHIREEVAPEVVEIPVEAVIEEEIDDIPYSPLVEVPERAVEIEEVQFEDLAPVVVAEESVERLIEEESPAEENHLVEDSLLTEENRLIEDDPLIEENHLVEVIPLTEEVEEIIPVVEAVEERAAPKMTDSAAALMAELFAMKRGTAFKEKEEVREAVEIEVEVPSVESEAPVVIVEEEVVDVDDVVDVVEPVIVVETVARQFADGETTIKMVYVGCEEDTLGGVLERYEATLDDVWNLEELADGVSVGDCVMLRYETTV